jgi:hypothetical protein
MHNVYRYCCSLDSSNLYSLQVKKVLCVLTFGKSFLSAIAVVESGNVVFQLANILGVDTV